MNSTHVKLKDIGQRLLQLHREDSGQDLIEYALIGALIGLSAVIGMGSVAKALNDIFSSVGAKIEAYIV
jgi:pilus assembly protein Flp/PilA